MNDHYRAAFVALITRRRRAAAVVARSIVRSGSVRGVADADSNCQARRSVLDVAGGGSNIEELQLTPLTVKSSVSSQPQCSRL